MHLTGDESFTSRAWIESNVGNGALIGVSSTTVLMKVLPERGEVDSIHGRIGLGVSIFQDLFTIPGNRTLNNPAPDEPICGCDRLALAGTKDQPGRAIDLLRQGGAPHSRRGRMLRVWGLDADTHSDPDDRGDSRNVVK